ncbi:translation initiation factor IF-2-like [Homalodisca vitripennis]|uniref:translation initiation factor IF-2-like n=1 Tax=Homalodisca vitripennis TaxID=197043 RepID=UPI001EEA8229|nr:translation initiation factor IF-2-like [Homalodisca vitripennis]
MSRKAKNRPLQIFIANIEESLPTPLDVESSLPGPLAALLDACAASKVSPGFGTPGVWAWIQPLPPCCNFGKAHSAIYRGCVNFKNKKQLSYAAAARKVQRPAPFRIEPPKPREAPAPAPPATVDYNAEPSTENREGDYFEMVRRRRHRPARKPENRGARSRSTPKTSSSETRQPPASQQLENPTIENTPAPARPALPRSTPRPRAGPPKPATSPELQAAHTKHHADFSACFPPASGSQGSYDGLVIPSLPD